MGKNVAYAGVIVLAIALSILALPKQTFEEAAPYVRPAIAVEYENGSGGEETADTPVVVTPASPETDVTTLFQDINPNEWYVPFVQRAFDAGMIEGKGDGIFDPMGSVSLAELSVMLSKAYHGTALTENRATYTGDDWSAPFLQTVKQEYAGTDTAFLNILNFMGDHTPLDRYNVSYVVGMLLFHKSVASLSPDIYKASINIFSDSVDCTQPYLMGATVFYELMEGPDRDNSLFSGGELITRSEICAILCKMIDMNKLPMDKFDVTATAPTTPEATETPSLPGTESEETPTTDTVGTEATEEPAVFG